MKNQQNKKITWNPIIIAFNEIYYNRSIMCEKCNICSDWVPYFGTLKSNIKNSIVSSNFREKTIYLLTTSVNAKYYL